MSPSESSWSASRAGADSTASGRLPSVGRGVSGGGRWSASSMDSMLVLPCGRQYGHGGLRVHVSGEDQRWGRRKMERGKSPLASARSESESDMASAVAFSGLPSCGSTRTLLSSSHHIYRPSPNSDADDLSLPGRENSAMNEQSSASTSRKYSPSWASNMLAARRCSPNSFSLR